MNTKVLVIDDERLLVKSTCMALTACGFETRGILDGKDAVAVAREYTPDVILLDIMMPGDDGWAVLGKLKADGQTRGVPVIIFTAREYSDGLRRARAQGAADYLPKPFEVEDLKEMILRCAAAEKEAA